MAPADRARPLPVGQRLPGRRTLPAQDTKTHAVLSLRLAPPERRFETALEGRHFAATWALFCVNGHVSMYGVLPPDHRDYWRTLERQRASGKPFVLPLPCPPGGDPFTGAGPQQPIGAARRAPPARANRSVLPLPAPAQAQQYQRSQQEQRPRERSEASAEQPEWSDALPVLHMNDAMRQCMETIARARFLALQLPIDTSDLFEQDDDGPRPAQSSLSAPPLGWESAEAILSAYVAMGFNRSAVQEALAELGVHIRSECSVDDGGEAGNRAVLQQYADRGRVLDWLCVHVPEDELPVTFRPRSADVAAASHDSVSLARHYASQRLCSFGFSLDAALYALQLANDVESVALERLWRDTVCAAATLPRDRSNDGRGADGAGVDPDGGTGYEADVERLLTLPDDADARLRLLRTLFPDAPLDDRGALQAMRDDEQTALASILGDALQQPTPHQYCIHIRACGETVLDVRLSPDSYYPYEPPVCILWNDAIPKRARLEAVGRLGLHAAACCGSVMLYRLANWVEQQLGGIVQRPGRLAAASHVRGTTRNAQWLPEPGSQRATGTVLPLAEPLQRPPAMRGPLSACCQSQPPCPQPQLESSHGTSERLREELARIRDSPAYRQLLAQRAQLPAYQARAQVLAAIRSHAAVVICGETGCGKTTQVPQLILEDMTDAGSGAECRIICTQPRRIAAISVANRVAAERGEAAVGGTVGYAIRLESRRSRATRILFCTTGVLLRQLQSRRGLQRVSHVIVDEVHERSVEIDFLLIALRRLLRRSPELRLRVILMSATVNARSFADYFGAAPVIDVPGRVYPVRTLFLDDVRAAVRTAAQDTMDGVDVVADADDDAAAETDTASDSDASADLPTDLALAPTPTPVAAGAVRSGIHGESGRATAFAPRGVIDFALLAATVLRVVQTGDPGAILVFLPGMAEIRAAGDAIRSAVGDAQPGGTIELLPLHSALTTDEHMRVFRPVRAGARKVVLCTNIAETSVTVDDVAHVIDTGRMREMLYDSAAGMSVLAEAWISRASGRQRAGRAGRTRPGTCYRLYSQAQWEAFDGAQTPELCRMPLEQVCLQVLALGCHDVHGFLAGAMDPPDSAAVDAALTSLRALGIIDGNGLLTALGRHAAALPVDLRVAKLLIYGTIFRCLDPALAIAACLSYRSPFTSPMDKRAEADGAHGAFAIGKSDLLAFWRAFSAWRCLKRSAAQREFCAKNYLSFTVLQAVADLMRQFREELAAIGFLPASATGEDRATTLQAWNTNAASDPLIRAVVCAALYPNVARVVHPSTTYQAILSGALERPARPSQLRFYCQGRQRVFVHPSSVNFHVAAYESPFVVYHQRVRTTKVYLRDTTMASAYALLLFGGDVSIQHEAGTIAIDKWLRLRAPARIAVLANELRGQLEQLLRRKLDQPQQDVFAMDADGILDATVAVLASDGQ